MPSKNPPIALLTDTHMGARGNCENFNENFLQFFSEIFFPLLKEKGIKTIIHLGDLGNYRKQINTKTLTLWKKAFFEPLQEFNCYFIVGNHDCYYKNTNYYNLQRSLELEEQNKNFIVADTQVITIPEYSIDLLPWLSTEDAPSLLDSIKRSSSKYLLCHSEFTSSETPYTNSQIPISELDKYQRVFSGHFHKQVHISPSIYYIGSTYPITWADHDQDRGVSLFYPEEGTLEFIKNPLSLFHKILFTSSFDIKTIDVSRCAKKHVIISLESSLNQGETLDLLIKKIEQTQPLSLSIKRLKDSDLIDTLYQDSSISFSTDTLFYMEKYINNVFSLNSTSISLDVKKVYSHIKTIYNQALQVS